MGSSCPECTGRRKIHQGRDSAAESLHPCPEFGECGFQRGKAGLDRAGDGSGAGAKGLRGVDRRDIMKIGGEELDIQRSPPARRWGDELDHRRFAPGEFIKEALCDVHAVEAAGDHAGGVPAEFAKGLRPAQEEFGEQDELLRADVEGFASDVPELLHAAAGEVHFAHEPLASKRVQSIEDGVFVELGDRQAIVLLVAAGGEAVEGHGIGPWNGLCFLDERAQNAGFVGGE